MSAAPLRRPAALLLALLALCACRGAPRAPASPEEPARLDFRRDGRQLMTLDLPALLAAAPAEDLRVYDPYYNKQKSFRALPLRPLLERGLGAPASALRREAFVLRARDGYTVPVSGARLLEDGAYLAIADREVPGWEPIGPQRTSPGPFYLIWRGVEQADLVAYPRPWQLAAIEIARFEALFPRTVPPGAAAGSPAQRGFRLFQAECVRCHAINRQGGRVGPELNVPQSIVEYRPEQQIRAYIRNPRTFRYGNMPAHEHLGERELDELMAYLRLMKDHKQDDN